MEAKLSLAGSPPEDVRAHMDQTWTGTVTVVQAETMVNPSTERYARVSVCFHGRVAVSWCGDDEHTFDACTGMCIESSDGRMKGWRIAPHEMHRFNAIDAAKWLEMEKVDKISSGNKVKDDAAPSTGLAWAIKEMRDNAAKAVNPHDQQDIQPVRSVLFVATCYPGGSFAVDAIDIVYNAMHAIAMECGLITKNDQCEYVTMEGVLVGQRFDVIISTDDWLLNILRRECAETHWWNSQVLPRKRVGSSLHFLSTVIVKRHPVPTEPTASPTLQQSPSHP